jgi:hypothetical protein
MRKNLILLIALAVLSFKATAQNAVVKFAPVDASPLDVAYYPANVAKVKKGDPAVPIIKLLYSRPAKKGREIFGVLEQFDKVWRLGANECTEICFNTPVFIGDKKIKPGKYSLFAVPSKDKWTIIVNKQLDRWGAFAYDEAQDVVRTDIPVTKLDKTIESFSIAFTELPNGTNMVMAWDQTQVSLPIMFKK